MPGGVVEGKVSGVWVRGQGAQPPGLPFPSRTLGGWPGDSNSRHMRELRG